MPKIILQVQRNLLVEMPCFAKTTQCASTDHKPELCVIHFLFEKLGGTLCGAAQVDIRFAVLFRDLYTRSNLQSKRWITALLFGILRKQIENSNIQVEQAIVYRNLKCIWYC